MGERKKPNLPWIWALVFFFVLPASLSAGTARFYFVQITDTHLGIKENLDRTKKVVAAINQLPMDVACVVHTGDVYDRSIQGDEAAVAKAANVFKALRPPIYFLAGNNEINLNHPLKGKEVWTRHFGPLISGAEYNGVRFVFAYTDPLEQGRPLKGYDPFKAIQAQMDPAGTKPVILFHHAPSVDDFYKNSFHGGWKSSLKVRWQALLDKNNVQAVIAGHFHRDELHWLGKIPLYLAGPVAEKYGRQACFRIYEYHEGRLGYTAQYLE